MLGHTEDRESPGSPSQSGADATPFLGAGISRYVDETGRGDETLWHHICRDFVFNKPCRVHQGPHCSPHDFHREDFLVSRLSQSERFLDLAIATIDSWSEQNSEEYSRGGLHLRLLDHTESGRVHSKQSVRPAHGTDFLVKALSVALCHHANKRTDWWLNNEPRLRAHRDVGVRYLLFLAYREDLSGNLSGIAAQLLDESLHHFSRFRYELGELANTSYHLLTAEVQDRHQEIILATRRGQDDSKDPPWRLEEVSSGIATHTGDVPLPGRPGVHRPFSNSVRDCPRGPAAFSWGGWVAPPVDLQRILGLSDQVVFQLLCAYTHDEESRSQLQIEGLVGGRAQLTLQLAEAAACAPHRFLDFVAKLAAEECHPSFIQSVLRGAATHLRYRFGNLQPFVRSLEPGGTAAGWPISGRTLTLVHGSLYGGLARRMDRGSGP